MKAWAPLLLVLCALFAVLGSAGCEKPSGGSGDCAITGTVVDAVTAAPIESTLVLLSSVDPCFPHSRSLPYVVGRSDENGRFWIFPVSCDWFHFVDVEKEGYAPARRTLRGGGTVSFALEPVVP